MRKKKSLKVWKLEKTDKTRVQKIKLKYNKQLKALKLV